MIFENILCNFVYFLGTVRAQISVDMSPGLTNVSRVDNSSLLNSLYTL